MEFLADLWIPILASAAIVFFVSSVIHMVLPIHKSDHRSLPTEAALAALRDVPPGEYVFPYASSTAEMQEEGFKTRLANGPVGFLNLMPHGSFGMGGSLVQWFLFSVFVSLFCAYLGSNALPADANYLHVFRITGTVAFLGYATANVHVSMWKGGSWWTTTKFAFDGLVYSLVTAGTFAWLWPAA